MKKNVSSYFRLSDNWVSHTGLLQLPKENEKVPVKLLCSEAGAFAVDEDEMSDQ